MESVQKGVQYCVEYRGEIEDTLKGKGKVLIIVNNGIF